MCHVSTLRGNEPQGRPFPSPITNGQGSMTTAKDSAKTAIDLFCGCGGLSLGLRRAGFRVIAAVDNDALSASTYATNHKNTLVLQKDIREVDPKSLMEDLRLTPGELDLLAGCPPCQGFSTLRTLNGGRDIDDPMNDLVLEFARFVEAFLPKAIMMENVPALSTDKRLTRLQEHLKALRYIHEARIRDAALYGVPQRRRRLILLARRGEAPKFALPASRRRSVAGAIRRLRSPSHSTDLVHNYAVRRADHVMSMIRRIPKNGGSRTDLSDDAQLECHRNFDGFKDVYGRMSWGGPAPTITGGCINPSKGRFLHPEADRAITLREAALLQGFPASYRFDLSRGRYPAAQMIGNAFPPRFAELHARVLHRQLGEPSRRGA